MKREQDKQVFLQRSMQAVAEMAERLERLGSISLASLDPVRTLIVSIDMNNGFAREGALASPRVEELCAATGAFVERCLQAGYPVLPFSDCHRPDAVEFAGYPPHCLEGSSETALVKELAMLQSAVVSKNCTNAFLAYENDWAVYDNIVVTGCCTDICVYQFAVTLKCYFNQRDLNRRVIVPLDLVDTYDAPGHCADLLEVVFADSMLANGIEVVRGLTD